jgi:hypothetical protein
MDSPLSPVKEATLRELIAAGAVAETLVVADGPGFAVVVKTAGSQRRLSNKHGEQRLFASMDTLVPYLLGLGVTRFCVDASEHRKGRLRRARPDRAEALRRTRTRVRQASLGLEARDG